MLIETTGLADPVPILQTLMVDERVTALYQLESVITVVDAAAGMATLDTQEESVKQAAVADRLLLTKTDIASSEDVALLKSRLRDINPAAGISSVINGAASAADLFQIGLYDPSTKHSDVQAWLNAGAFEQASHSHKHDHGHAEMVRDGGGSSAEHHGHHHDVNRHDDRIRSFCMTFEQPLNARSAERLFDIIIQLAGPEILRVKGILNLEELGLPTVIHGVQHIFHPPVIMDAWPSDDRRTRIVFITRELDEAAFRDAVSTMKDDGQQFELHGL